MPDETRFPVHCVIPVNHEVEREVISEMFHDAINYQIQKSADAIAMYGDLDMARMHLEQSRRYREYQSTKTYASILSVPQ